MRIEQQQRECWPLALLFPHLAVAAILVLRTAWTCVLSCAAALINLKVQSLV